MRLESGRTANGRSGTPSAAVATASELYRQGKLSETVDFINNHTNQDDPRALFLLAKAFTKLQKYTEARKKLQFVLRKTDFNSEPKQYEVRLFLGNLYLEIGEATKAIQEFNRIKDRPEAHHIYRSAFSGLASANALLGRFNKAFGYLEKARSYPGSEESVDADLGFILLIEGSYDEALRIFNEVFKKQPDNVRNTYHLANARYLNGQYDRAIEGLRNAIQREPQAIFLRIMLGDTYKALGEFRKAIKSYQTCLEISPHSEKKDYILFQVGNCERLINNQGRAIDIYQQLLKECSKSPYKSIASAYIKNLSGDEFRRMEISHFPRFLSGSERFYPMAIAQLLKYWSVQKQDIELPVEQVEGGISLPFLRRHSKAFGLEQKCFQSNLEQIKRLVSLGFPLLVYEYSGLQGHYINIIGFDDGKGVIIAQDPNFHEAQEILYPTFLKNWLYHTYKTLLVYPKSEEKRLEDETFEERVEIDYFDEVSLLLEEGQQFEAIARLSEMRKKFPEDRSSLRLELEILLQQKKSKAIELGKQACEKFPEEYWSHRLLGDSYFNAKQYNEALKEYQISKDLLPKNAEILAKIGETYIFQDAVDEGIKYLKKSIELDPRDFWAYGKLGWGYLQKGSYPLAEKNLLYALDSILDYSDSWGWLHAQLGLVYRFRNKYDKSVSHLKKSLMSNDKESWFEEEFQKSYKLLHNH